MNKIFAYILIAVGILIFPVSHISAIVPVAEFERSPLFGETDFLPGSSVDRTVTIHNTTSDAHRAIIKSRDVSDVDGLGAVLHLTIKLGSDTVYDGTFADFFTSTVILPQVAAGESKTFHLIATLEDAAGNGYQNKQLQFGLEAGLEDGDTTTDTTVTIGGSQGGGGGGNGLIIGSKHLIISNEAATPGIAPVSGIAIITWDTNMPATSLVIYGATSGGPYSINLTAPNFGYPFSTAETDLDTQKTTSHSVTLTGLLPGEYSYRVVSRASPPTVGYEYHFVVGQDGVVRPQVPTQVPDGGTGGDAVETGGGAGAANAIPGNAGAPGVAVQTGSVEDGGTSTPATVTRNGLSQLATALFGGSWLSWRSGAFLLFILFLLWLIIFWKRRKKEKEEDIKNK